MGNKVYIYEFIEFSNDFSTASTNLQSQLKEVEKTLEQLHSMNDFTGKAANRAKKYFNELHQTLLKSFEHLLIDLEERMERHLNFFEWDVDSSNTAIVQSDYLLSLEAEINDSYEPFTEEHELIRETINNVSDISNVYTPSKYSHDNYYTKSIEILTKLEENFETYTNKDIEKSSEIDELLQHIETTIKDSGKVTGDNQFTYFMGSTTPDSLLALQGHNQEKFRVMISEATESRDSAIEDMNEASEEIASKALQDLENGLIEEEEYYLFLDELLKLNNEEDVEEVVSSDFIDYVRDNMGGISDTFQNNLLAGIIDEQLKNNGNGPIKNSDLIKAMQSSKLGSGFFRNQGKWIINIGESIGRTLTTMTVGVGVYVDYTTTSMTIGQSSIKNWADGIITATFSGVSYHGVFTVAEYLSLTNPVGLGILASIGTATIVSTGFNYAYNNNHFWLKTGVDWTGQQLDNIGETVSGFFSDVFTWVTN